MLNSRYAFDNFAISPTNRLAHAAAMAVAENPDPKHNPLFIWGSAHTGKTHLLQAICGHAAKVRPDTTVVYLTASTYIREYVESLRNEQHEEFWRRYHDIDLLLIDDVQRIEGKEGAQAELLDLLDFRLLHEKSTVFASTISPGNIPTINQHMNWRLRGGLVVRV